MDVQAGPDDRRLSVEISAKVLRAGRGADWNAEVTTRTLQSRYLAVVEALVRLIDGLAWFI